MTRTAEELVKEMEDEKEEGGFFSLFIVVKLADRPRVISHKDPDPVKQLSELIRAGGKPIGFLGMSLIDEQHFEIRVWALKEYEGEEWVVACLKDMGEYLYRRAGGDAAKWIH